MLDNYGPAANAFAITAGSGALAHPTRGLFVGGAGNVTVTMEGSGASVQFVGVTAGSVLPLRVTHVTAATATSIVGLW